MGNPDSQQRQKKKDEKSSDSAKKQRKKADRKDRDQSPTESHRTTMEHSPKSSVAKTADEKANYVEPGTPATQKDTSSGFEKSDHIKNVDERSTGSSRSDDKKPAAKIPAEIKISTTESKDKKSCYFFFF